MTGADWIAVDWNTGKVRVRAMNNACVVGPE